MTLILFIIYERSKGTESFWHPYFEVVELVDLPGIWSDKKINQIMDPELVSEITYFKEKLGLEWETIKAII